MVHGGVPLEPRKRILETGNYKNGSEKTMLYANAVGQKMESILKTCQKYKKNQNASRGSNEKRKHCLKKVQKPKPEPKKEKGSKGEPFQQLVASPARLPEGAKVVGWDGAAKTPREANTRNNRQN